MNVNDVFIDTFERVQQTVHGVVEGLSEAQLTTRPSEKANPIAWLTWHTARMIDVQLTSLMDSDSSSDVWTSEGWADKFELPFDTGEMGYGMSAEDVAKVHATSDLLSSYYDAVHAKLISYLETLNAESLDEVIDTSFTPAVTHGARTY